MQTITQLTAPQHSSSITLRLYPSSSHSFKDQVEEVTNQLAQILSQHTHETDPLSLSIWNWFAGLKTAENASDEEIMANALKRIEELIRCVLVDELIKVPLQDPVLIEEKGWTCERKFVELSALSEFMYRTHQFALEMLQWIDQLPIENNPRKKFTKMTDDPVMVQGYKMVVLQRLRAENDFTKLRDAIGKDRAAFAERFREVEKKAQEAFAKAQEEVKQKEQNLSDRLTSIEETHRATHTSLSNQIDAEKQKTDRLAQQVQETTKSNQALQGQVRQLNNLSNQRAEEIEALKRRAKKRGACNVQ